MRPFAYHRPSGVSEAVGLGGPAGGAVQYLGGGTNLLDLMKLDVMRPQAVVDITRLEDPGLRVIQRTPQGLRLGALVTMAALAADPGVARDYPVLRDSLWQAASAQLRNMATLGGNVLQRTRCPYFRDTGYDQCNKREPGSGCAALDGVNRQHAVLGVSDSCIASYPGDLGQALVALDAAVEVAGPQGTRTLPFAMLHRPPGDTPHLETTLRPGELITAFLAPGGPWPRSRYLKVRDRQSYEFALASAAVALDLDGDILRDVRIGLGGVSALPWRAARAEAMLKGRPLTEEAAEAAAAAEFAEARPQEHNAFKVPLGRATLVRALLQAQAMKV